GKAWPTRSTRRPTIVGGSTEGCQRDLHFFLNGWRRQYRKRRIFGHFPYHRTGMPSRHSLRRRGKPVHGPVPGAVLRRISERTPRLRDHRVAFPGRPSSITWKGHPTPSFRGIHFTIGRSPVFSGIPVIGE